MAKLPKIIEKIRSRLTRTGRKVKFATVKLGADLSKFVPAPQTLLEKLGVKKAFVQAGVKPTVRSIIVTSLMLGKAKLEAEQERPLSPVEVKRIRGGNRYLAEYLNRKLRHDLQLTEASYEHPSYWDIKQSFQENWMRDYRRFLKLAADRSGIRFELTKNGEWIETPVAGASRKMMNEADWHFYTRHLYANKDLYGPIEGKLEELPPGEVSPKVIRRKSEWGKANQTGRSVGSYRGTRRSAA